MSFKYDAFISHAVEDKISIANELCFRLEKEELKIWYSGSELNAGDIITSSIEAGLKTSRYGIVIFTKNYISKPWTIQELLSLQKIEKNGRKVILPVIHEITLQELAMKGFKMEDRFILNTEKGIDYVIERLVREIKKDPGFSVSFIAAWKKWLLIALFTLFTIYGVYQLSLWRMNAPGESYIETSIQNRIDELQQGINSDLNQVIQSNKGYSTSDSDIKKAFTDFKNTKSYYRNEYTFSNGVTKVKAKVNVDEALQIDAALLTPFNAYGFTKPGVHSFYDKVENKNRIARYAYSNTIPVTYTYSVKRVDEDTYAVLVSYTNYIRYIEVSLMFPSASDNMKRHYMNLTGFLPEETYLFDKENGEWHLEEVK